MEVRWVLLVMMAMPWPSSQQIERGDHRIAAHACCPNHEQGLNVINKGGCKARNITDPATQEIILDKPKLQLQCEKGMYLINPELLGETFDVESGGQLNINQGGLLIPSGLYCLTDNPAALVCFIDHEDEVNLSYTVTGILGFISVFFLIITFLVYVVVSELRDLQGKCTMCMLACLALGFIHLSSAQLFITSGLFCIINGFLTYFWMLSTFFWMNIVSINVMMSVVFKNKKIPESNLFLYYNVYGWGASIIFLISTIVAHNVDGDHLKPGFGTNSCWFNGRVETWGFFYGPMAVLIALNIILFLITSQRLWHQRHYNNVSRWKSMKYKFLLYLKLVVVMGISWIFEILGFVYESQHVVWLLADTINCLQGLIFFLVLVIFRKRALKGLATRGVPLPCIKDPYAVDEECEDIMTDEEAVPSMTPMN